MQTYDLIMLVVLIAAAVLGAWKGMAWQLASLSSILVSYFVAVQFRDQVAAHIDAAPPWNRFLAMLLLYIGTSLIVWVAFRMIAGTIERLKLKSFDRQMGALVGLAKGVLLCAVITLFAVAMLGESDKEAIINSNSGYYIAHLLHRSEAILPEEIHRIIGPYIDKLDRRLDDSAPELNWDMPTGVDLPTASEAGDWLRDRIGTEFPPAGSEPTSSGFGPTEPSWSDPPSGISNWQQPNTGPAPRQVNPYQQYQYPNSGAAQQQGQSSQQWR